MASLATNTLLLLTLLLCCLAVSTSTSNSSSTPIPSDDKHTSPINQALNPLYSMTDGFLHIVFPKGLSVETISTLLEMFTGNSQSANIDTGKLITTVLNGYAGFATCVVIGLLLVLVMPLVGLFCCCCRLCGKCGGETQENDPKNAKCKRILCAGLLLVFTLVTIGGMVMVFFSATQLFTIVEDGTIDRELQSSIQELNSAVHHTVDKDIVSQAEVIIDGLVPVVNRYLDDAGNDLAGDLLGNLTDVERPINNLAKALDGVNKTLDGLISSMETFETLRNGTEQNYTRAQALAATTNLSGIVSELQVTINIIDKLTVEKSIRQLTSIKDQLKTIPNLRKAYGTVNESVSTMIQENFNNSKSGIQDTVDKATKEASNEVKTISSSIKSGLSDVTSQVDAVRDTFQQASEYAKYGWYASFALGGIIALVTLLYMCGLMFGCGERPGPDANFCNKGCGARCLLAAVGFTFIFYSLLMLLTVVFFFVGSLATSQVCWTIQEPNSTIEATKSGSLKLPGSNLTFHSIVKAYGDCLNEQPIGSVVKDLDLGLDKQRLLDMLNDQLKAADIDGVINSINVNTDGVNFIPPSLNKSLEDLENFNDFNSSVIPNMTNYVETVRTQLLLTLVLINNTLSNGSVGADQTVALGEMRDIFLYSREFGLYEMAEAADVVTDDIIIIEDSQEQLKNASQDALGAIVEAQKNVTNNGSDLVQSILRGHVAGLTKEIGDDLSDGIDKLFSVKCDKLAESLKGGANIVCDTVFDPWNGLWFSLGWSLIMLIPCIIVALFVVSLFRREQSYEGDYKEDFSQYVNHQSTQPPRSRVRVYPALPTRNRPYEGERIPLESRGGRSYYQGDNTNKAFRDDYGHHISNGGGGGGMNSRLTYY